MRRNRVAQICIVFLSSCIVQSLSQLAETSVASLSKAPVGFYNRIGPLGDVESAGSLGNAPVGLFSRVSNPSQIFQNIPLYYALPLPFYQPPISQLPKVLQQRPRPWPRPIPGRPRPDILQRPPIPWPRPIPGRQRPELLQRPPIPPLPHRPGGGIGR